MALQTNILSYYKMDGNSNDSLGLKNGTDTSVSYANANGKINNGGSFTSGSSSKVSISQSPNSGASAWTVTGWIKTASTTVNGRTFVSFGTTTTNQGFSIYLDASHHLHANPWGGGNQVSGTTVMDDGNFHHFAVVYTGSLTTIYSDGGDANSSGAFSLNLVGSQTYFGAELDLSVFLTCSLDEIGFWQRALTATEISTLYNGGTGISYPFNSGFFLTPR